MNKGFYNKLLSYLNNCSHNDINYCANDNTQKIIIFVSIQYKHILNEYINTNKPKDKCKVNVVIMDI